ncbi:MAG: hypothetical protein VST71_02775 [Nitrospirota bacterium]|nr:hypothetical protein [Nitrospirota bacterium]
MEYLKKYEEIVLPDERHKLFMFENKETGNTRKLTLKDIYLEAKSIELKEEVPERVRSHFSTAINLLVYSWFHYPFNITAQFLAFVTVEMALKERFNVKNYQSFSNLVKRAVSEGLVRDEGFEHIQYKCEAMKIVKIKRDNMIENVKPYVDTLVDVMPSLRNELAHGSSILHMHGTASVKICAAFINQLFCKNTANKANY